MNIVSVKYLSILLLVVLLWPGKALNAGQGSENGALIVRITSGDNANSPAHDVYVEAYGFVKKSGAMKSFVLKMTDPGQFEGQLPSGIYDVFVSEDESVPRCRRVLITPGLPTYWTLKLEYDDVYTNQQISTAPKK